MHEVLEKVERSLKKSNGECYLYLEAFLKDYQAAAEKGDEVICRFEDMEQFSLSAQLFYLEYAGVGDANLTKAGESFFYNRAFLAKEIFDELHQIWQVPNEESRALEEEMLNMVKAWLAENWLAAIAKTGINTPLYYCEHYRNYKVINLMSNEEMILF